MKKKIIIHHSLFIAMVMLLAACTAAPKDYNQVGTLIADTITGVPCCVYLPYQYTERVQKDKTVFPVLYLQHGMYGNENDWPTQGNLMGILDSLLRRGEIIEQVIIMPDNCPSRPSWEEEKANATNGAWEGNFAAFIAECESRYSISRDPARRSIAGLSMGGYHTMMVSSVLDGQFRYVGMFSPATFVHRMPSEPAMLWIGIGTEDFLYDSLQVYRQWLEDNHREYTYYESTGGHTWPNWQDYLVRFLTKIQTY